MPRPRRRAILRGMMLVEGSRRRRFLFRVDADGLLAVRIGNPLAFSAFLGILLLAYLIGWPILGPASLLAGGALGLAALGVLDNAIARTVAGQPREAVLRSRMNLFLSRADLRAATVKEGVRVTHLETTYQGARVAVDITRPVPGAARKELEPLLPHR
jgi:hypothetical protein